MQDERQFCLALHLHPGGRPLFNSRMQMLIQERLGGTRAACASEAILFLFLFYQLNLLLCSHLVCHFMSSQRLLQSHTLLLVAMVALDVWLVDRA